MAFMELLKFPARSSFPATGDNNRLYVDLHSKRIYYWDRGAYQIASPDIVEQGSNPISEAFSYAGIVATVALLPTEGIRIGDVYIVEQDEGHEQNSAYVWSGTEWIEIGGDMEHLVAISWENLKVLRDEGELVPGAQYRITDYTCTTTQENTQSAGHVFDIIVTADDVNKLNENARACLHANDSYFANSKLEAWKLKYCLDNDTTRFAWADEVNGKGVIYRMIDEFNNDVPYDFKNIQYQTRPNFTYSQWGQNYAFSRDVSLDMEIESIQYYGYVGNKKPDAWSSNTCWFKDNPITTGSVMYNNSGSVISYGTITAVTNENYDVYTFSKTKTTEEDFDVSLNGLLYSCYNNTIRPYVVTQAQVLNRITFVGWDEASDYPGLYCFGNTFGNGCYNNTFGNGCYDNTFVNNCGYNTFSYDCYANTFGNDCVYNTLAFDCHSNTFGNGCYNNTFGDDCYGNTLGNNCDTNTFGESCFYNTFGNDCDTNTFGNGCQYNTFGIFCNHNTFGNNCDANIFGNRCSSNTFDDGGCESNTFGSGSSSNTFGGNCTYNTFGNDCDANIFEDQCSSNIFGNSCHDNTFGNRCSNSTFGSECQYLKITNDIGTTKKYISVDNGVQGASNANKFDLYDAAILDKNYQVTFKKSESGKYLMLWATDTGTVTGKVKETNTTPTWEDIV